MVSSPPKPKKNHVKITAHGHTRTDPYSWMKDENWKSVIHDPSSLRSDIREHLEAENKYTELNLENTMSSQEKLYLECKSRIKAEDSSVPIKDGEFSYFQRFKDNSQYPIFCRHHLRKAEEQVILDSNKEAENSPFFRILVAQHSPNHCLFSYIVDLNGSEIYSIIIKDIDSDTVIDESVKGAAGSFEWSNDSRSFLYTVLDENHRPNKVFRHLIGTSQESDKLIYEEMDSGFFVSLGKTKSRSFFIINAHDHQTSEIHLASADRADSEAEILLEREPGTEYYLDHNGEEFFLITNSESAEDFRIVKFSEIPTSSPKWTEIVEHRPGSLILSMSVFSDHLVWLERTEGLPRLKVISLKKLDYYDIIFDEEIFDLSLFPVLDLESRKIRFSYSSLATPMEIYDYDLESRERFLLKSQEIPSGHDPKNYIVRRLIATAEDGEIIPISVVYSIKTQLDGSAPLVLYGYGSYGLSMPASFSSNRFSLIDRGFIYAIAHVRGGSDCGYRWYREGRGPKKMNSFKDFIAVAEHLISMNFTSSGRIIALGGSAGGLLVGAVLNLRPELFGGAVAEVPFVDVLNTMCDDSLPLTPPEWPEWGNPILDESAFHVINSYSPYENIDKAIYPSILATAGLSDPRVTYWEPAKWVSRLRDSQQGNSVILLKTNMGAGHAGVSGRFAKLEEISLIYAFILNIFDINDESWEEIN